MKVVYVAGKYRDSTNWATRKNILAAEQVAVAVWKLGAVAVCPHKNSAFFEGAVDDDEVFLHGYLELLRRCDAIMLVEGWETSVGTKGEIAEAHQKDIPIFNRIEDLKEWLNAPSFI